MENFRYRTGARTVAYIDVVVSSIALIGTPLMVFLPMLVAEAKIQSPDVIKAVPGIEGFSILMCVLSPILALWCIVEIWAAIMLLLATKEGAEPIPTLRRARIWRNAAILFLAFDVIFVILLRWYITLAITIIFRGVLLFFVIKFIDEVDTFVKSRGQQVPMAKV